MLTEFRAPPRSAAAHKLTLLTVESLRPLREGLHRLLDLALMGLEENNSENLLYPHRHLPATSLLLLGVPAAPYGGD
jgi:hypothetical protein